MAIGTRLEVDVIRERAIVVSGVQNPDSGQTVGGPDTRHSGALVAAASVRTSSHAYGIGIVAGIIVAILAPEEPELAGRRIDERPNR